ncbi:MAG: hypothetical protein ACM3QU_04785 [Verrucomicrobiota bacterium]
MNRGRFLSSGAAAGAELFARALAGEARHPAVLAWVAAGKPAGNSFPPALDLEEATNVVGPHLG